VRITFEFRLSKLNVHKQPHPVLRRDQEEQLPHSSSTAAAAASVGASGTCIAGDGKASGGYEARAVAEGRAGEGEPGSGTRSAMGFRPKMKTAGGQGLCCGRSCSLPTSEQGLQASR
jgi:hypothetical protein